MHIVIALVSGVIFGLGLLISGMANPAKVLAFLDLAGRWDPSLLFVMGGAVMVAALAFRLAKGRTTSMLGEPMHVPQARRIDRRLVFGSLLFGVGWGLAGYCPGPALATVAIGRSEPLIFVAAMLAGMALFELLDKFALPRQPKPA
jgi:uncharacterized membrane protein YedE/YeeE